ncbi:MAG: hypothetical protein LC623_04550 [Halobacteriales archaeon]|nr:hypothetical protein [Halobacteriales archaeon]
MGGPALQSFRRRLGRLVHDLLIGIVVGLLLKAATDYQAGDWRLAKSGIYWGTAIFLAVVLLGFLWDFRYILWNLFRNLNPPRKEHGPVCSARSGKPSNPPGKSPPIRLASWPILATFSAGLAATILLIPLKLLQKPLLVAAVVVLTNVVATLLHRRQLRQAPIPRPRRKP